MSLTSHFQHRNRPQLFKPVESLSRSNLSAQISCCGNYVLSKPPCGEATVPLPLMPRLSLQIRVANCALRGWNENYNLKGTSLPVCTERTSRT